MGSRVIVGDNSFKTLIVCSANLLPFLLHATTSTARPLSRSWPIIVGWLTKITGGRLADYFLGGGWTFILSAASRLSR